MLRAVKCGVLALAAVSDANGQALPVETLWACKDKDGRTILTNQQQDTVGKECRIVQQQRVTVVRTKPIAGSSSKRRSVPSTASGSAFAVGKHILLTNQHVVSSCSRIHTEPDGGQVDVIASDKKLDLAALRTKTEFSDFARLSTVDDVTLGQEIVIAGFPLRGVLSQGLNVTTGTVSAVAGLKNDSRTYQITAPVQPGNSGGPVFDGEGRVIGVVVGKLNEMAMATAIGSLPQNVNFAVSPKAMRRFLQYNEILIVEHKGAARRSVAEIAATAQRFTVPITCTR
jgi:S1-C subfamily serine protease